jgi:hypothetical protein
VDFDRRHFFLFNFKARRKEMTDTIGRRFNLFRRLAAKSMIEFSSEASLPIDLLTDFENDGSANPGILDFKYFCEHYGLNLTWLLTGQGKIFYRNAYKIPFFAHFANEIIEYTPQAYEKILALIEDNQKGLIKKEKELMGLCNTIINGNNRS